jgi:hypothetical protein
MVGSAMAKADPLAWPLSSRAAQAYDELEKFGMKVTAGGAHASRTMMLEELTAVLTAIPIGSTASDYREAVLLRNVLGKSTESTRHKSFRHLRELDALDESVPISRAREGNRDRVNIRSDVF